MADQSEPKGRYPRQEVSKGQKHGYIGEVEVYDPPEQEAGYSNAEPPKAARSTTTRASAKDSAPAEKPVVGTTGTIDDSDAAAAKG